jgi:hypothetical protein
MSPPREGNGRRAASSVQPIRPPADGIDRITNVSQVRTSPSRPYGYSGTIRVRFSVLDQTLYAYQGRMSVSSPVPLKMSILNPSLELSQ